MWGNGSSDSSDAGDSGAHVVTHARLVEQRRQALHQIALFSLSWNARMNWVARRSAFCWRATAAVSDSCRAVTVRVRRSCWASSLVISVPSESCSSRRRRSPSARSSRVHCVSRPRQPGQKTLGHPLSTRAPKGNPKSATAATCPGDAIVTSVLTITYTKPSAGDAIAIEHRQFLAP